MTSSKKWIECRVTPGMFSDERTVEVRGRSFFVEKNVVRSEKNGSGQVEVIIVEKNGEKWAVLPTPTRESIFYGA